MSNKLNRRDLLKLGAASMAGAALTRSIASAQEVTARAKRVVFLFQGGGPSQLELFDPKPGLNEWRDVEIPESVIGDRRITTMTAGQKTLRVANSLIPFAQYGESGMWASEAIPNIEKNMN